MAFQNRTFARSHEVYKNYGGIGEVGGIWKVDLYRGGGGDMES